MPGLIKPSVVLNSIAARTVTVVVRGFSSLCPSTLQYPLFVKLRLKPPYFKYRNVILPVNLIGWRVEPVALLHVLVEDAATLHVAQAELT